MISSSVSLRSAADSELNNDESSVAIPYSIAIHVLPVSPRSGWNTGVTKSIFSADASAMLSCSRNVGALGLSVGAHVGLGYMVT